MRLQKIILFSLLCLTGFFAKAQPTKSNMVDGLVAVVGDKIILKSDVESEYANWLAQGNDADPDMKCIIIDQLLTNKLMLRQAELDSLTVGDEEIDGQIERRMRYFISMIGSREKLEEFYGKSILEIKDEFRPQIKEMLLAQKMQEKITANVTISPREVQAYFAKIPADSIPYFDAEIEIGQIVLFPEVGPVQKEFTIEKLNDIRNRILKGENFTTLALLYSEDPGSAKEGGSLGFFGRGEMVPEFEAVAFKLKPGEVSQVIRTKFGYHILQLVERRGDRVHCRHILIKPPVGNRELERARVRLDSIRKEIASGTIDFTAAVRKHSEDDESKQNGGMLMNDNTGSNSFTIDQLTPDVYFAIDKLKPGELSDPQPYAAADGSRGFRVFYLKSRTSPHQANLENDYARIQNAALSMKRIETVQTWFMKTKVKTYINIDEEYQSCENLARWQ
ncbi:MAG: peptidylprolyl isomerase [Sphingobacteriaceae bacterium]|nr:peptidylprolyl isomerase [Sphingobacteriaceae bacterium]